jgi:hypothetical protein
MMFAVAKIIESIILSTTPPLYGGSIFTPSADLPAKSAQDERAVMNLSCRRHNPVSPRTDP